MIHLGAKTQTGVYLTSDLQILSDEQIAQIKANLKIGDTLILYKQSTGSSTTDAMSQDAVTRELGSKVSAVDGMGLSQVNFTNELNTKLNGLSNYDDTTVKASIVEIQIQKANADNVYTKGETDALLTAAFIYKDEVATKADLPTDTALPGNIYKVIDESDAFYVKNDEGGWDPLHGALNLEGYALKSEIPKTTSALVNNSNFIADANYVHTDNNYDNTAKNIVDNITTTVSGKADKIVELEYTAAEAGAGLTLVDNQEITITEPISTMVLTSLTGSGAITFTALADLVITLPGDCKWDGEDTPSFGDNFKHNIVYYKGTVYADRGVRVE